MNLCLISVLFWHVPITVSMCLHACVLSTSLFGVLQDAPDSYFIFSVSTLESAIPLEDLGSFYWRMVFRNQYLSTGCACCCLVTASKLLSREVRTINIIRMCPGRQCTGASKTVEDAMPIVPARNEEALKLGNGGLDGKDGVDCCCCCSVAKLYLTLCSPMDCSTPGFPVLHYFPEFAQIHVH